MDTQQGAETRRVRWPRWCGAAVVALALLYLALLVPEPPFQPPAGAGKKPFAWNTNRLWLELEGQFVAARAAGPTQLGERLEASFGAARQALDPIKAGPLPADAPAFTRLEARLFDLAPLAAAAPQRVPEFVRLVNETRFETKKQSEHWDLEDPKVRERLYRLLFGGRMALEMVLVQAPSPAAAALEERDEPSAVPGVQALGAGLRSGDILVSRGGAPTSSLIARGNDFPGSFSHVALVHVDERTGAACVIESLIERGVIVVPLADFMREKRLRLMALRPRADLPALRADPQLPNRAAEIALQSARLKHIPYDFSMNFREPSAWFCSEVVSSAYQKAGLRLWMGMTFISSPTVTAWLGSVGVRHFETQEPSDLEYDPQLRVVAEWRDPDKLFQAHLDDAVTDAMLEQAPRGAPLPYPLYKLPLARVTKAWSAALNLFGKEGPIPEGMSATTALRVSQFREAHRVRKITTASAADAFRARHGYAPPYWELLELARNNPGAGVLAGSGAGAPGR